MLRALNHRTTERRSTKERLGDPDGKLLDLRSYYGLSKTFRYVLFASPGGEGAATALERPAHGHSAAAESATRSAQPH